MAAKVRLVMAFIYLSSLTPGLIVHGQKGRKCNHISHLRACNCLLGKFGAWQCEPKKGPLQQAGGGLSNGERKNYAAKASRPAAF